MNGRCIAQIVTFVVDLASLRSAVQGKDSLTLKHLQALDSTPTRNTSVAITCHLIHFCSFSWLLLTLQNEGCYMERWGKLRLPFFQALLGSFHREHHHDGGWILTRSINNKLESIFCVFPRLRFVGGRQTSPKFANTECREWRFRRRSLSSGIFSRQIIHQINIIL